MGHVASDQGVHGVIVNATVGDTQTMALLPAPTIMESALNSMGQFTVAVIDKDGNTYFFQTGGSATTSGASIEDRNGNHFGANSNGLTDTAGRNPSSGYGLKYTYSTISTMVNYTPSTQSFINGVNSNPVCPETPPANQATLQVISAIELPNGESYQFSYESEFGLIKQVTYPDGGWVKYTWALSTMPDGSPQYTHVSSYAGTSNGIAESGQCTVRMQTPVITERQVSFDGTHVAQTQNFIYSTTWDSTDEVWTAKSTQVTTTDNVLGKTFVTSYLYTPIFSSAAEVPNGNSCEDCTSPMEQTVQRYDWGTSSAAVDTTYKAWYNPFQLACEFHTLANGQTSGHIYQYSYGQISDDKQYDFGQVTNPASICAGTTVTVPSSPPPARETAVTSFQAFQNPLIQNFVGAGNTYPTQMQFYKPTVVAVYAPGATCTPGPGCTSGTEIAETDYAYDLASLAPVSNVINHDTLFDSGASGRGNITQITKKCVVASGCTPSTTSYQYDLTGQIVSMTDGCVNGACADMTGGNHTTTYSYTDEYVANGQNDTPPSQSTNTYVTSIQAPATSKTHVETFKYDWLSGDLLSSEDENSQTTTYSYDCALRLNQINYPDGGQSTTTYDDGACDTKAPGSFTPTVTTSKLMSSGINETTVSISDGMYHVTQATVDDPEGNETSESVYDGEGRVYSKTNPHRSTASSTNGISYSYYDVLGRPIYQIHPDGNVLQWCYDGVASTVASGKTIGNCHPHLGSGSNVSWVDSQDESGNDWQRSSDGLGRLVQVMEPNGTTNVPSMETDYTYDGRNDLITVKQWGGANGSSGVRTRSFTYTSLSQLLTASNPETGTITYGPYDANGNLTSKVDARSIKVNYLYDNLNRLYSKSYSKSGTTLGDPTVCMQYDTPLSGANDPNPIGRLTLEWTQSASTACPSPTSPATTLPANYNYTMVSAHDSMGRVQVEQQCPNPQGCATSATKYVFNYAYDLAGNPTDFNNGMPAASSTATAPALNYGITYQNSGGISAGQIQTVATTPFLTGAPYNNGSVPGQPQPPAWSASLFPSILLNLPVGTTPATWAYDPEGHMVNEQAAVSGTTAGLKVVSSYDSRGRITQEQGFGHDAPAQVAQGSFGVIEVDGAEQTASPKYATGSVSISGSEQNTQISYPCGSQTCYQTIYDQGSVTLTVNGSQVNAGYQQGSTPASIATSLAANVNSASVGVTATASGSTVTLTAQTPGTSGNVISISATSATSDPGTGQGQFAGPSFTPGVSGSTLTGGANSGGTPVYDSGTMWVTITNPNTNPVTNATTSAITWGQNSTSHALATAIASAITAAQNSNGNFVTATVDSNWYSVDLQSAHTGSSDNYPVVVNVTQTGSSLFLAPSFEFNASSTTGGQAAYSADNYAPVYNYFVPSGGYAANGNLLAHSDTVMGDWAFQYDTLNRLTAMAPAGNAPANYVNLIGCYGYDSFGNRTLAGLTSSDCTGSNTPTASYNANNQVISNNYQYDAAGNVYSDGNNTYAYDGEGRLCAVETYSPSAQYQYIYDAEGLRVAKATFTGAFPAKNYTCAAPGAATGFTLTNQYLLDAGGDQVTELSGTGAWVHSNVWAGAHLDATYDTTAGGSLHFHLADPLGTRRVQTNVNGVAEANFQSLPYGDGYVYTSLGLSTSDDATEHHFTSKEHDSESGNDYFEARYYASSIGRFMSPDWSAKVEPVPYSKMDDPQSLNLYAYVQNNPLGGADPDGHQMQSGKGNFYACADENDDASQCLSSAGTFAAASQQALNSEHASQPVPEFQGEKLGGTNWLGSHRGGGSRRKGERGRTAKPSGTDNPNKKFHPDPNREGWLIGKDENGQTIKKPDPAAKPAVPEPERIKKPKRKSAEEEIESVERSIVDWLNDQWGDVKQTLKRMPGGPDYDPATAPGGLPPDWETE